MSRRYDPDRLRTGLCTVRLERVFRVIHRSHRAVPLAAVPAPSRFSDPQKGYSVLYGAETVRCAFWETLARNRFARRRERELPHSDVEARLVVSVRSDGALSLVDPDIPMPSRRYIIPPPSRRYIIPPPLTS